MNTEDSVLVSNSGDWERHRGFLHQFEKYSVRTFRDKAYGRSNPHFPIISREELVDRYSKLLSEGLKLIVASPIDPQDAELAGALLYDAGVVSAEVALGAGTVRRVTGDGKIDVSVKTERRGQSVGDYRIDAAVREVRRAVELIRASLSIAAIDYLLFEFSWYRVPVGCQNERLIFWELATSASQEDALERLLLANC